MVRCPVPTYLVGVDEPGGVAYILSIHGRMAVPNRVDYVTAKHALIGMTRGVALECAQTGVTINALMPGWVLTPHAEGQIARQMAADNVSREKALDALLRCASRAGSRSCRTISPPSASSARIRCGRPRLR